MAANSKKTPQEALRARIAARRQARKTEKVAKYAQMQEVANKTPEKLEQLFASVAATANKLAYGFENLIDHLDLVRAPKGAPTNVRVAAAKNYAKGLKKLAEESPDMLETALQEAYKALDEQAAAMEIAAEALGIDLGATPAEQAFTDEGRHELELGEEKGEEQAESETPNFEAEEEQAVEEESEEMPSFEKGDGEEEKEATGGSDGFVTDRNEGGQPKTPAAADVPRVAGAGSDNFVTDRNKDAQPEAPAKMEIPQAQGEAAPKSGSKKKADGQIYTASPSAGEPAESFVKDIPQSQGDSEVNKAATEQPRGVKQEFSKGEHSESAEAFVSNIPQSQGESEVNKMSAKLGSVLTSIIKKAMTRKDYILIADAVRETAMSPEQKGEFAERISGPLAADNPRFDQATFVNYCCGRGGSRPKRQQRPAAQPSM
jgi:hypothetical protein